MTEQLVHKLQQTVGPHSSSGQKSESPASGQAIPRNPAASPSKPTCESHDPRDAAHSPPSVVAQHLGPPTIEHDYPQDSTTRRHSFSEQEKYYMR
ncbi:kynureninase [Purpureocillium lavendulum]|uniref:Kynureninase n=1 Tax=Purpureocillium lavendulum TaxID=1247861 RepID=A0AB34FW61_9HYPO|nr:kynureninase [Purpureocillium lavendulum]